MMKHYVARKYRKRVAPFNEKMNNIRIDLCADYEKILEGYMDPFVKKRKSKDDAVMDFFRLQVRLIEQKPRKIVKSKEFSCPKEYEDKLKHLEECILSGKNLIPFMSKGIQDLTQEDLLLYDWGIYHFHISDRQEEDTIFMERSDYLLMAYVDADAVYFLDVVPHKSSDVVVWADTRYMDIMKNNWSELFERFRWKEYNPIQTFNDKETYDLRKSGALIVSKWGDGAIFSPGGGYASDTTSIKAVQSRDYWMKQIEDLERVWVEEFGEELLEELQKAPSCEDITYVDIKMISCTDAGFLFIEKQTKLTFFVKKEDNMWSIKTVNKRVIRGNYEGDEF